MNKKIVGFVLAMCLSFCLGVANVFADFSISQQQMSSQMGIGDIQKNKEAERTDENWGKATGAKEKTNYICMVFNFTSRGVYSSIDQDKTITLFNAGEAFLVLKYNEKSGDKGYGSYSVASITLSGSLYIQIEKSGGVENFLSKIVEQKQLECSSRKVDEDGKVTVDNRDKGKLKWLDKNDEHSADKYLALGVNYSLTIDFTAAGGASVSFAINGKQTQTVGYDSLVMQVFVYNLAGTLEKIEQVVDEYDVDRTNKAIEGGADANSVAYYKESRNTVHMDETGRQSFVTDTAGNTIMTYTYSSNGSMFSSHDYKTNNTTFYDQGRVSFIKNDKGFTIQAYFYHENGSLNGIKTYNWDADQHKNIETSIQAYRYGKLIGSAKLPPTYYENGKTNQPTTFDELRKIVDDLKENPDRAKEDLANGAKSAMANIKNYKENGKDKYIWNSSYWQDATGKAIADEGSEDDVAKARFESEEKARAEKDEGYTAKEWDKQDKDTKANYKKKNVVTVSKDTMNKLKALGKENAKWAASNFSAFATLTAVPIYENDITNKINIKEDPLVQFLALFVKNPTGIYDPKSSSTMTNIERFYLDIQLAIDKSNGFSAIIQISLTIGAKDFETDEFDDKNTKKNIIGTNTKTNKKTSVEYGRFKSYETTSGKSRKTVNSGEAEERITRVGKVGQTLSLQIMFFDHGQQNFGVATQSVDLAKPVNQKYEKVQDVIVEETVNVTKHVDPAVEGDIWSSEATDEELKAEMEKRGIDENDEEAIEALKKELSQAKLEAMADRLGIDKNDKDAMDLLEKGFYINDAGEACMLLAADSVNLMEGSGFQAAGGEIYVIKMDKNEMNKINAKREATGDNHILIMGDVSGTDEAGYKTVTMNTGYSGGWVMGANEIAEMKTAINEGKLDWVNENTAINQLIKAAIFGDKDKILTDEADKNAMFSALKIVAAVADGNIDLAWKEFESVDKDRQLDVLAGFVAGVGALGYNQVQLTVDAKTFANLVLKSKPRSDFEGELVREMLNF